MPTAILSPAQRELRTRVQALVDPDGALATQQLDEIIAQLYAIADVALHATTGPNPQRQE